jgi:hypothetical protein
LKNDGAVQKVRVTDFLEPLSFFYFFKKSTQKNRPF